MKLLRAALFSFLGCTAYGATLTHDYQFQGNLNDSVGSDSLIGNGGTVGSGMYTFGAQQGLDLLNGFTNDGNYSIVLQFSLTGTTGYRKLTDFSNLAADSGLYNLNSALNFYPIATGPDSPITANTPVLVVLTRDAGTNTVTGYVNGVQELQFVDSSSLAVFSQANNIAWFFQDDAATGGRESSGGTVTRIQIYDGALTANEVGNLSLGSSVPEPSTMLLLAAGVAAFGVRRRLRR